MSKRKCPGVFETAFQEPDSRRELFRSDKHGVLAMLDSAPMAAGHALIVSRECVPHLDRLHPAVVDRLHLVATYTGLWLMQSLIPKPKLVVELVSGAQVPHPHLHRIPTYVRGDWIDALKAGGPALSDEDTDVIHAQARFPEELALEVESELGKVPLDRALPYEVVEDFA